MDVNVETSKCHSPYRAYPQQLLFTSHSIVLRSTSFFSRASVLATRKNHVGRNRHRQSVNIGKFRRFSVRASSLDDSKRNARSKYDNIPDLNERYLAELGWIEREYGAGRLGDKNIVEEAQRSISIESGRPSQLKDKNVSKNNIDGAMSQDSTMSDIGDYLKIRNRLLSDTAFIGVLGLCITWGVGDLRDVASFTLGLLSAVVYVWLLARSVDRMAEAAKQNGLAGGDPLQAARIALLALTVVGSARHTDMFSVVVVILGFLSYKIASLLPLLTGEAFE